MAGNTIGTLFRVTTWGESHGPAVGAVIDGCPPGIDLTVADIQAELDRRRPGRLPGTSPRQEPDQVEILSGVFADRTTGTPVSLAIRNRDAQSGAYDALKDLYRPGHGDFTYQAKYGVRDHRGGGRASARETVGRVAAGAIAKKVINRAGIAVRAWTAELGGIVAHPGVLAAAEESPLYCPDPQAEQQMLALLAEARAAGDSLGGIVAISVTGCPAGLGEPVFDKIDADLAYALMGIGAVKGVEIGAGFAAARLKGSENNDPLGPEGFKTNRSGGILAGITNGAEIAIRVACKPIPSISLAQETVDREGNPQVIRIGGRHDACVIPRIVPVCEAMAAIVIADHLLRQRAVAP
jgi:chorismate synthase